MSNIQTRKVANGVDLVYKKHGLTKTPIKCHSKSRRRSNTRNAVDDFVLVLANFDGAPRQARLRKVHPFQIPPKGEFKCILVGAVILPVQDLSDHAV